MRTLVLLATAFYACGSHSPSLSTLPGPALRHLAGQLRLPFGTDILDTWPQPLKSDAEYAAIVATQFNFGNPDWCACWAIAQPSSSTEPPNYSCFDEVARFVANANMTSRTNAILPSAHNLLAPEATNLPRWLRDGAKNGTLSAAAVRAAFKHRIDTAVSHWLAAPGLTFNGLIVINEALWNQDMAWKGGAYAEWPGNWVFGPTENLFAWAFAQDQRGAAAAAAGASSPTDWFSQTFVWARAAADAAGYTRSQLPLLYTDYGIETATPKADAVLRLLTEQLSAGTPIDGIGFQAHLQCDCRGYPLQPGCNHPAALVANMQRFVNLGLAVWITELDVAMAAGCTQEMQAEVYGAVLEACLQLRPHCSSFMLWGFTDRYTWLDNVTQTPAVLDADYRPKPAYFALQQRLVAALKRHSSQGNGEAAANATSHAAT